MLFFFFFQAEDGIRDGTVTGVQTCALPIWTRAEIATREGDGAAEGAILMRLARVLIDARDLERARGILPRLTALRPGDVVVQGLSDEIEHPEAAPAARAPVAAAPAPVAPPAAAVAAPVIGDVRE